IKDAIAPPATHSKSSNVGGNTCMASLVKGMLTNTDMSIASHITASTSHLWGLALKTVKRNDLQFNASTNSIKMNIRKSLVLPCSIPFGKSLMNAAIRIGVSIMIALSRKSLSDFVNTGSSFGLGGLFIKSGSGGLKPSASAGNPSVGEVGLRMGTGK